MTAEDWIKLTDQLPKNSRVTLTGGEPIVIKNFRKINNQIFTVGGSKNCTTSLKDLTVICEKITQNKIKFQKISKTSIYDIPFYISNNKKVTKTYGWKPRKNVKNIVLDIYKWLKINKKNIKKYFK